LPASPHFGDDQRLVVRIRPMLEPANRLQYAVGDGEQEQPVASLEGNGILDGVVLVRDAESDHRILRRKIERFVSPRTEHERALRALVLATLGKRLESTSGTFPMHLGELIRNMMGNVSDVSVFTWGHAVGRVLAIPGKLLKPWLEGQETGTGDKPNPLVS